MNAFETQNYLALKWFGVQLFESAEPVEHTTETSSESERYKWTFGNETTVVDRYVFDVSDGAHIYMLVPDMDYAYAVNSDSRSDWKKACAGGVYSLTGKGEGETVEAYVSSDLSEGVPKPVFMAYRGNIDWAVKSECADYISHRGSTIRFLFDNQRSQVAITSIPYENGWEITVNGEKVEPLELYGGLIGIQLEKGTNSVVMSYTPPCFRISLWFSAILFVIGLYITLKIEHEAARRRKVRMAFRAVELNISRMTADELDKLSEDTEKSKEDGNDAADDSEPAEKTIE